MTKLTTFIFASILLSAPLHASDSDGNRDQVMTQETTRQAFVNGDSAVAIVEKALNKIDATDATYRAVIIKGGPAVFRAAAALDALTEKERAALPLAGVPLLIKDNVETKEWATTAGSLALAENKTGRDADLIARLREAGAIILGKANLSEWANFRSENSISGWSGVGGQARNAHDPTRSPCGSSAGSAAAVALGYVPVAIGSETDGSIICPAALNGVVGFKPTHGLVLGDGIVPLASSQDTAGPIANSVMGATNVLAVIIGSSSAEAETVRNKLARLSTPENLNGIRLGIVARTQNFDARRDKVFDLALNTLKTLGADITPGLAMETYAEFAADEYDVLLYEFKRDLNAYLADLPNGLNTMTLETLIAFNASNEHELSLFDQSIFIKAQELAITESEYLEKRAKNVRAAGIDGIDAMLAKHNLDALIGISNGPAWTIDDINGDAFHGPSMSSLPAVGGHPHITVPMGDIRGMPIGLSIVGKRFSDADIAAIAAAFEQAHL